MLGARFPLTARTHILRIAAIVGSAVIWSFVIRPALSASLGVGQQAWVDLAAVLLVVAVFLTIFVIMERTRRSGLIAADKGLRELLDLTNDAMLSVDRQLCIVRFNRAAQRMFGFSEQQAIGQPVALLLPADVQDRYLRRLRRFIASSRLAIILDGDREVLVRRENTSLFPAALRLTRSVADRSSQITIAVQDMAARRAAEAKLDWERNLMRALIQASPDYIFAKDIQGRFLVANNKVSEIMGAGSPDRLIGRTDHDFYPPETAALLFESEQQIMRTGKAMVGEQQKVQTAAGREQWLSTTKVPFRDGKGVIVGLAGVVRDVTADKHNAATLNAAKKQAELSNRAKSEFIANMSHELRTPLNAIIGFSDIIKAESMGPVGTPVYRDYAGDINDAGAHLLAIINDILDLSKVESGADELHCEETDVADLARSVTRLLSGRAEQSGVIVSTSAAHDLPRLFGDRRKLKQVLANMLSNAIKFTERGGRVELRVWCEEQRDFFLQVSDTGIGMAPRDIPVALAQFGQVDSRLARQHEGTGLGLPLSKALVELHGGTFEVNSELGVGTTVTVFLPGRAAGAAADTTPNTAGRAIA